MLPLGSILYLKDGSQKLMIISRGVVATDTSNQPIRYDYIACKYPLGLDVNQLIYFNQENVDKVLYKGYEDEDEERFKELYQKWEEGEASKIPKGRVEKKANEN